MAEDGDKNKDSETENSHLEKEELPIRNIWSGRDNANWSKTAAMRGRIPHNMVTVLPGLAGAARNNPPSKPIDA